MGESARIRELEERLARLEADLVQRDRQLAERDARIEELEKLLEESRRAGKRQAAPFSKGEPAREPKRPGRKRGDAHGTHNHRQAPNREPDRTLEAGLPGCCPHCAGLIETERVADQWQVDLPDVTPTVTRLRVHVGRCGSCGRRVQGRHRDQTSDALGAAGCQVGPATKAWAAWLHYELGLSFVKCSTLLGRLGVDVTAGALCQAAQSTSTDLVAVHNEIVRRVNTSRQVVMDETGWRVGGHSTWLWTAATPDVTVYNVADGRGFGQACHIINHDYDGVIVRDGWPSYRSYDEATHQTCLAHLLRRCHHLQTDLPDEAKHTPWVVAAILGAALDARELPADQRAAVAADLTERVKLLAAQPQSHNECRKLVKHLTTEADALFTFLTAEVDATNWRAEQAIRPAVVNRKVWGGNRTWRGAITQSQIMTVLRTARQQGTDPIEFLTQLARAPTTPLLA